MIRYLITLLLLAGPTVVHAACDDVSVARSATANGFKPAGLTGTCTGATADDVCTFVPSSLCYKGFKTIAVAGNAIECRDDTGTNQWFFGGSAIKTGATPYETLSDLSNHLCETPAVAASSGLTCEASGSGYDQSFFVSGESAGADDACECQPTKKQKEWNFDTGEWEISDVTCDKTVAPMSACLTIPVTNVNRNTVNVQVAGASVASYVGGYKLKKPCYDDANTGVGTCEVECYDGLVGAYFQDAVCATVGGVSAYYLYGRTVTGTSAVATTWTNQHCTYLNWDATKSAQTCTALEGVDSTMFGTSSTADDTCTCAYGDHNPDHDHPDPVWDHTFGGDGWEGKCVEWTTATTSTTVPTCNTLTQRGPGHGTCRSEQESSDGASAVSGAVVGVLAAAAAAALQ